MADVNSSPDSRYQPQLHIVLHQPEIPGNTGAVGRTCLALQAKLWLVRPLGFQVDERSLRRAGLDYWQHLQWQVVNDWNDLMGQAGFSTAHNVPGKPDATPPGDSSERPVPRIWMFTRTARTPYFEARFARGDWLVFGSETSGLPPSLLADEGRNLRIPVAHSVRSLNLSSSVAVAGYEAARQTGIWRS